MENQNKELQPVTTGDWVLTLFIVSLPLIGLIMLFVWAFSGGTHPSKANFAKASLIWMAIAIVVLGLMMMLGVFAGMMGNYANI